MRVFQELNNAHTRPSVPWHSSFILFKSYMSRQLLGTENCSPESVPAVRHEMASQPYTTNFVATRESIFRRAHLLFSRLQDNVNWKTDSQLMLSGAVKQGKLSGAVNLKKTWIFKFDSRQHRCKAKPPAYNGPLAAKKITRGQNSRFRERKVARKPDASFPAQTELRVW